MPRYKLIFSDIDGTLTDSGHIFRSGTKETIRKVSETGLPFVMVSARVPVSIRMIMNDIGFCGPLIAYNGAVVKDEKDNTLWERGLTKETALAIRHKVLNDFPDVLCCTFCGDMWMADDGEDPEIKFEAEVINVPVTVGAPEKLIKDGETVHKLLCIGDPVRLDKLQDELRALFPMCRVFKSMGKYLEIISAEASKSAAAEVVCEKYGIPAEQVAAFGDNFNDIDLLKFAGLGIAVGNAPDAVKKSADMVAPSNDEDGVARTLEKMFLDTAAREAP